MRSAIFVLPRRFLSSMASTSACRFDRVLFPPREVQGMLQMDRAKFSKSIEIPYVPVAVKYLGGIRRLESVRALCLERLPRLKTLHDASSNPDEKLLLLDPDKFANASEQQRAQLLQQVAEQQDTSPEFGRLPYRMEYEDWDTRRCLRAVLPEGVEISGFEQCGHIVHLNLRDPMLPFRYVVGQILLDKNPSAKTVINKLDTLTHEFRVMDMELLAGEPNYMTEMVEQGIRYRLDYSKVFWNSRLNRVHEQTVNRFGPSSVVFDAFAGVGPFILPAVKRARVRMAYANDLNPEAIKYLHESIRINKIPEDRVETFTMDAAEFIRRIIPEKVALHCRQLQDDPTSPSKLDFHAIMNLPGHSAEFLPYFRGFLANHQAIRELFDGGHCSFCVHCHFFVKADADVKQDWYREEAARIVRSNMDMPELDIQELAFSRSVSSRKTMYCARIQLPLAWAFGDQLLQQQQQDDGVTAPSAAAVDDPDQRKRKEMEEEEELIVTKKERCC